jgi:hypothetical protein
VPSITATAEPLFGRVRLEVDFSDTPAATYVHVHRGLAAGPVHGVDPVVRVHGVTTDLVDTFGTWTMARVSGGRAVFYDTELPLDTAVYYRADSSQALTTASATAGPVTIASDGDIWLKDPIRPAHDVRITLAATALEAACDPTRGVYFVGFGESSYASKSGRFTVEDSPYPIISGRPRQALSTSMVLVTRMLADRDAVRTLLSTGDVLLLQTPPDWGYGDMYVDVGDASEARLARDHRKPYRQWQLPIVQTDQPPGLQFGVDAARWLDTCDVYATWGAVKAAGKTWLDVLQREVG